MKPEKLAKMFHDVYEKLAPKYGYKTRKDTKKFDANSKNGKLMIATCKEIINIIKQKQRRKTMKIQTNNSLAGKIKVMEIHSDNLYKFYNFETGEKGDCLITFSFIQRFKDKKIEYTEEKYLAWELVQLLKRCTINLSKIYNFNFYIEDGQIKIELGSNCAYIKNKLPEYENYLKQLGEETQSYIEFELERSDNNI